MLAVRRFFTLENHNPRFPQTILVVSQHFDFGGWRLNHATVIQEWLSNSGVMTHIMANSPGDSL